MQPSASTPDPQLLLEHLDWVRRLARSLVADSNVADDLVQDTWIAYSQHPPRTTHLRAWLAEVTRNAARQLRRRESRRSRQESQAARAEALPSSLELLAKVSTQRHVVELVLALDEPFRQTVLLRYFENLSPATIAARTGVALATVRSRLRRALEILRDRLDRDHGGDGSWLAALLPLVPKNTGVPSTVAGVLAMSTKTIVVTAATIALLATGVWTWVATENAKRGAVDGPSAPDTEVSAAELASPVDEPAIDSSSREAQSAESPAATATPAIENATLPIPSVPAAEPSRVRVHVVTPDGQPFEVALEPDAIENQHWNPIVLVTHEPTTGPALPQLPPEARTDLGKFTSRPARSSLPPSCIGELELVTPPPVFVTLALYREWLGCDALAPGQEDIQFVLDPSLFASDRSGLRMRVIDRVSKLPIPGALVGLSSATAGHGKATQKSSRADGTVSFIQPWPSGPCTVRVEKQGYAQLSRDVVLTRGEVTDFGDVDIGPATPVLVRVETDLPLDQYSVSVHGADELRSKVTTVRFGGALYPGADGAYELYPGDGETVLSATTNSTASTQMRSRHVIVTPAQAGTTIVLELHEFVPVVLHTAWVGEGRTVEVRDELDILELRAWSFEESPIRLQFIPGTYRVIFAGETPAPAERAIQVDNAPTEITLD